VVAGYVVPHNAILVEVVQDGNTGLVSPILAEFPVIGLGPAATASVRPVSPPPLSAVGGGDADARARPEPAVHQWWLKVWSVTPIKVTFAT